MSDIFFVVDDDSCILDSISVFIKKAKFECTCFENANDRLECLCQQSCDLLITDVKMPEKNSIDLLVEAKRIAPWIPVLVMTSYGDVALAVNVSLLISDLRFHGFLESGCPASY